jgi:hypothetical protein
MTFQEIEQKIKNALLLFYKEDSYLIDNNVHERSLTFRLGMYLQQEFSGWDVDCEYNKNCETFHKNKLLYSRCVHEQRFHCEDCNDRKKCTVFPDIIIHKRGAKQNLLVIEAKCNANEQQIEEDKEKIEAYLNEPTLCYSYGLFIDFQDSLEQTLIKLCWFSQAGDKHV